MANGEEDLKEKNKGRKPPVKTPKYSNWTKKLGRDDAEMLMEKSEHYENY